MKINSQLMKSITRGVFIVLNTIIAAATTYAGHGHTLGANKQTVIGILWALSGIVLAVASRWLDKNDPAFGKIVDTLVLPKLEVKINAETNTSSTPDQAQAPPANPASTTPSNTATGA